MKIHFQASPAQAAQNALQELTQRYGQTPAPEEADVLVALGGDGQTLHSLQDGIRLKNRFLALTLVMWGICKTFFKKTSI